MILTVYWVGFAVTFLYLLTCYGVDRPKAPGWMCAIMALIWPYTAMRHLYGYWSNKQ